MGKAASSWQAFISCNGSSLIIRHLKSGLTEDLEILRIYISMPYITYSATDALRQICS